MIAVLGWLVVGAVPVVIARALVSRRRRRHDDPMGLHALAGLYARSGVPAGRP